MLSRDAGVSSRGPVLRTATALRADALNQDAGAGIRQFVAVAPPDVSETSAMAIVAVQYGCRVPDKRLAIPYANDVVRARQSGDVNSERLAFASLAAACRQLGVSVDTLLADAEYRARAQVPPHH